MATTPARAGTTIYDRDLDRGPANFETLTPVSFLARSAAAYPIKTALIHGETRYSYAEMYVRCRRLASALARRGIGYGDTVAILAPNVPAMAEAHFGVPMAGAVLNPLNIRLDPAGLAFCLSHGEAKLLICDREFAHVVAPALALLDHPLTVIDIDDPLGQGGELLGEKTYEALLAEGDPDYAWQPPADEWQAITLLYTSGTTGNPKGVVYHARGAYLTSLGNALSSGLGPRTVYLWTLPMFHCSGWCHIWAMVAAGGTQVCLRKLEPARVFALIAAHGVTQLHGAPVVLSMLIHAPAEAKRPFAHVVEIGTGGAAPPSTVIAAMERMGFRVTHLYGATESYGPATICAWQDGWEALGAGERAVLMARQGVRYPTLADMIVADPLTLAPVPQDGATMGEVLLRGNSIMRGYLKNPDATAKALAGGWYHTGDLAVWHTDGYIEVKDRLKDIIISGGENISSLEVEEVLYKHPAVMEAAVVARPDPHWGETPCAFVTLKPGAPEPSAAEIIAFCRANLAHYKAPRHVIFGPLPKTATGKILKYELRGRAGEEEA